MADEKVCKFDGVPELRPGLCLGSGWLRDQITSNLNVASKNDWPIRRLALGEGDNGGHLRIIYNHKIRTPFRGRL